MRNNTTVDFNMALTENVLDATRRGTAKTVQKGPRQACVKHWGHDAYLKQHIYYVNAAEQLPLFSF